MVSTCSTVTFADARIGPWGQVLGQQPADALIQAGERVVAQRDPDQRGGDALGDRVDVEVGGRCGAVVVALNHQHAVANDQHAAQRGEDQSRFVVNPRQRPGIHALVLGCGSPPAAGRPGADRLLVRLGDRRAPPGARHRQHADQHEQRGAQVIHPALGRLG